MAAFENLALKQFVSALREETVFAQVLIRRRAPSFELRHIDDREQPDDGLRTIAENEFRSVAQFTRSGAFRPLKSSPNLQTGWLFKTAGQSQLEFALNTLYPNAVADWFAVQSGKAPVTPYRDFTRRQTGMYRITAMLTDAQAAPMIRACCHKNFCLKQRLWTVEGLASDAPKEKSLIPCLEPCAILLEFARKTMRLQQERERGELAKEMPADPANQEIREADFENPNNPRRNQLEIEQAKF